MATSRRQSASFHSPTPPSTCYDPLDIDSFINYDQVIYPSPSISPASSRSKPVVNPNFVIGNSNNTLLPPSQSSHQQAFSGPSHQYDLHQQQTPFAIGALANTMAVNEANNMSFNTKTSSESFFGLSSTDDFIDFGVAPSKNPSFSGASDMDMDFDSSSQDGLPAFFYPQGSQSSDIGYVDPNVIGGQEEISLTPLATQSNVGRLWPGAHQQQAAIAKAQAQAQVQAQAQAQQQRQERVSQRQQTVPQQHVQRTPRPQRVAAHQPADPIVEERISRLLSQMRQGSIASSEDDATAGTNGVLPHIARLRKEEEDMDEDERLLASEEGKKLSSKERRQLRNKVSARAFRSRRKEYIGQLEGEVAAKTNEANEYRTQNQALMAENQRLSDLTRMLLSSSAFSNFLNDLSTNGVPAATASVSEQSTVAQPAVVQPKMSKDPNPNQFVHKQVEAQEHTSAHVGMTLIPDNALDFSTLDLNTPNNNGFITNLDLGYNHAQVFSVIDVPRGPAVDRFDTAVLSGKTSNSVGPYPSSDDCKIELPTIERMPSVQEKTEEDTTEEDQTSTVVSSDVEFDESDPAFALYMDATSPAKVTPAVPEYLFGDIDAEKVFARIDVVIETEADDSSISAVAMERFERMCSKVEAAFQRIGNVTSHL